jgi:hypothetical protein
VFEGNPQVRARRETGHARKIRKGLPCSADPLARDIERELRRLTDNIASSLRESANVLQRTSHQISNTGYA